MKLPDLGVAMAAITKNEGPFIAEWVAYHYLLGVEHFVIYDNRSDDATVEVFVRLTVSHLLGPRGTVDEAAAQIERTAAALIG